MTKIEKAISWMESTAKNNSHGYDQRYRWGEKGDYDCSAAVITAWQNAGVPVKDKGATYTGNIYSVFTKNGFLDVTAKVNKATGSGLQRGDVLLAEGHHVAMFCGSGKEVEASINEKGKAIGGVPGDQTGREFLIRAYRNYPWTKILRFVEKEAKTEKKAETKVTAKTEAPKEIRYQVTAKSGLNVRATAGGKILGAVKYGTIIKGTGEKSMGWYKVTAPYVSGWVSGDYIKEV